MDIYTDIKEIVLAIIFRYQNYFQINHLVITHAFISKSFFITLLIAWNGLNISR